MLSRLEPNGMASSELRRISRSKVQGFTGLGAPAPARSTVLGRPICVLGDRLRWGPICDRRLPMVSDDLRGSSEIVSRSAGARLTSVRAERVSEVPRGGMEALAGRGFLQGGTFSLGGRPAAPERERF